MDEEQSAGPDVEEVRAIFIEGLWRLWNLDPSHEDLLLTCAQLNYPPAEFLLSLTSPHAINEIDSTDYNSNEETFDSSDNLLEEFGLLAHASIEILADLSMVDLFEALFVKLNFDEALNRTNELISQIEGYTTENLNSVLSLLKTIQSRIDTVDHRLVYYSDFLVANYASLPQSVELFVGIALFAWEQGFMHEACLWLKESESFIFPFNRNVWAQRDQLLEAFHRECINSGCQEPFHST